MPSRKKGPSTSFWRKIAASAGIGSCSISAASEGAGLILLRGALAGSCRRVGGDRPQALADFADRHHLSGYLFAALQEAGGPDLPAELLEPLRAAHLKQWIRNEDLLRHAGLLADLFERAGTPFILLKGLPLASRFYGDLAQRVVRDLDVLVRPADAPKARRILEEGGFVRMSQVLFGEDVTARFTPSFEYRKDGVDVDLHWSLRGHPSFRIDEEGLWGTRQTVDLGGRAFQALGAEYELVAQILSIFTDVQLGTVLLKSFVDVHRILETADAETDWDGFFRRRTKEGLFRISTNVLDLVLSVLEARGRFIHLEARLAKDLSSVRLKSAEKKERLLDRSRAALRNKWWAFALYDATLFESVCWWGVSLPFRVAASPSGRVKWSPGRS